MGQRTAILIKRVDRNGKVDIRLIHDQWGFGKVMPAYFLKELMDCYYGYDKYNDKKTIRSYFKFNTKKNNLYKKSSKNIDVFDIKNIKEWFDITDNNNGGMIVEIIESKNSRYYVEIESIKISFVLGDEECYNYIDNERIETEKPFSRLVSANEYMEKTGGDTYCPIEFRNAFDNILKTFKITQVL